MTNVPANWADYVAGTRGITEDARKALTILVRLPKERIQVFHAAMSGRSWMYYYEVGGSRVRSAMWGCCEHNDYWRSVVEAVVLAVRTKNPLEEVGWFLSPIPNSKPQWAAPTTLAERMEVT